MSTSLMVCVSEFSWEQLHIAFNPLDPYPTTKSIIDRSWCKYILLSSNTLHYLAYVPDFESDVPRIQLTKALYAELLLLTDKLSRAQIIDYLTN